MEAGIVISFTCCWVSSAGRSMCFMCICLMDGWVEGVQVLWASHPERGLRVSST